MDALRNTINTQSIKTKQIVFQYPDGSFPEPGAILNVTDTKGHTDWTRDPNLDSITLVAPNGSDGTLTYSNTGDLELNGVPVGGGGSVSGGTNITISGGSTVNFDPTKGGGVNMLGAPMTQLQNLGFQGSADITFGANTGLRYNTLTKELIVNPVPPPLLVTQGMTVNGFIKAPYLSTSSPQTNIIGYNTTTKELVVQSAPSDVSGGTNITISGGSTVNFDPSGGVDMLKQPLTNADSITMGRTADIVNPQLQMNVPAGSGTGTIMFTDGTNTADINYSGLVNRLTATGDNIAIYTPSSNQLIEMGSILGRLQVSTQDQEIALRRYIAGGGAIDTSVALEANGIVQIGDSTSTTKPTLYFQGDAPSFAQIEFDNAASQLTISGSGGGVTSTKIATPLFDVATNTAGVAGQVLASQGAGLPPIWAAAGGGSPVILQSKTYTLGAPSPILINNTEFSAIPVSATTVTIQVVLQGGGGGGGGGLGIGFPPAGGVMSSGGGGGGGAGYSQILTQTLTYGASCNLTVGVGGGGGGGAQILLGSFDAGAGGVGGTTQIVTPAGTYSVVGGGGGGGGSSSGGSQAGGTGSSPGFSGSFTFSGPGGSGGDDGGGIVFGGAGGGIYGGVGGTSAGGSYGSPDGAAANMVGGQGLGGAPAYSGAGGGGGSGGAGGYGQVGGAGAPGYIQINILSFA